MYLNNYFRIILLTGSSNYFFEFFVQFEQVSQVLLNYCCFHPKLISSKVRGNSGFAVPELVVGCDEQDPYKGIN